jgi:hypothetical protein
MIYSQTGLMIFRRFFLISLLGIIPAFGQTADYWIIENPSALVIYNQYEQRLTSADKSLFRHFSAWQILSQDQLLSDQYTHVARTRHDQQIYYLQLADGKNLVNREQAGNIEMIKNARALGDTIRIKKGGRLSLKSGNKLRKLSEGMLFQRLFNEGSETFVQELDGTVSGWLKGSLTDFEIFHTDKKAAAYEAKLFDQVNRIFQSYNQRLEKLFAHLNKRYNKSLPPPKWERNVSSSLLAYSLHPASYQTQFPVTRTFLIQELNDLLHGSEYTLVLDEASITIRKIIL